MNRVEGPNSVARRTIALLIGTILFVCAIVFYYFSVLKMDYGRTILFDLGPHPDADEYFAQAQ